MNSEWSLDELYKGFDDPKFVSDFAKVDELVARNNELAEKIKDMDGKEAVLSYITLGEEFNRLVRDLFSYASLRSSANTKDAEAASCLGRLMGTMSATTKADTIIK